MAVHGLCNCGKEKEGELPLVCCLLDGLSSAFFLWKGRLRMGLDRKMKVLLVGLDTAENVLSLFQGNNPHFNISCGSILETGTMEVAVGFWTSFL